MSTPFLPEAPPMRPPKSESPLTTDEVVPTAGGGGDTSSGSENPYNGVKQSTYDAIDRAESAVSSLDTKWKAFQNAFAKMNEALVENLARSFGVDTTDLLHKDATAEQRHSVFGGKAPSAKQIAAGIKSGKYKNIVVLCGAGMSTSAGIPDFRSPDTGVYAQLKKEQEERKAKFSASKDQLTEEERKQQEEDNRDRELPTPESLFTLDYYRQNQKPFILRAGHMWPGKTCAYRPTPSHCFLKMIEPQLLRVYTQNIDELETCGDMLPRDKVRRCHGSFENVHCPECKVSYDRGSKTYEAVYQSMVVEGKPSQCAECLNKNPLWAGVMKPGIVFFGEAMSPEFTDTKTQDFKQCDLLIVMGTSLMVTPFSCLPELVSPSVPRLLLNGEVVGPFEKSLKADSKKIVDSNKVTPVIGRNRDMLVTLSKQDAMAESKKKDDPGNYRDCALVGDLDASVHTLAKWMGQDQALAALCRGGKCLNPKPDAGKASKLVPLPAEGSFNPRAAAAPMKPATPSNVASKAKLPPKPRVSPPPANSTTTASRGSVTGPAKPAAGKLPPIRGGGTATGKRASLVPPPTLKVVTEQTTATNATELRKRSLKPATRIAPSAPPNAKKRATSSSIARK